jgi:hypothetical protein
MFRQGPSMRHPSVHRPFPRHPLLRRIGLVMVLLSIFAVGFGGTFTCETRQDSINNPRPDPPPR